MAHFDLSSSGKAVLPGAFITNLQFGTASDATITFSTSGGKQDFMDLFVPQWVDGDTHTLRTLFRWNSSTAPGTTLVIPVGTEVLPNVGFNTVTLTFVSDAVRTSALGVADTTDRTMVFTGFGWNVGDSSRPATAAMIFNGSDSSLRIQGLVSVNSGSIGAVPRRQIGKTTDRDAVNGGSFEIGDGSTFVVGPRSNLIVEVTGTDQANYFYVDVASGCTPHGTSSSVGERVYFCEVF